MPRRAAAPHKPTAAEIRRRLRQSNAGRIFGFTLDSVAPGRAVLRLRVRPHHRQVHDVVHGGILAAMADTAAGLGIYMSLPRGTRLATIEMKINYLEPAVRGMLLADARLLRIGKNIAVASCNIRDGRSNLVATSLLTFSIGPVEHPTN